MGKQKLAIPNEAGSSQALLLPPDTSFNDNLDGNSPPWPTDDEEEEISDVEDLESQQPSQFPTPGSTPSFNKKSAYRPNMSTFFSHPNGGLRKKPVVLNQLTDGLEKVGVAKYERKRVFDVGI